MAWIRELVHSLSEKEQGTEDWDANGCIIGIWFEGLEATGSQKAEVHSTSQHIYIFINIYIYMHMYIYTYTCIY